MPNPPFETLLSSTVSRGQYLALEFQQDKTELANFLKQRFSERYILPFERNEKKNGFIMMASACLMIESLESFWNGWIKSPNSALSFCQFFDRVERFAVFRGHSNSFYVNVRCGIMHQGETTGGWHIRRDLPSLFNPDTLTLDATRFLAALDGYISDYSKALAVAKWNEQIWKNFRRKMKAICANTEA